MSQVSGEDPFQVVQDCENRLATTPGDPALRHQLALALERLAFEVRSVTRDGEAVITSVRQQELCLRVADRITELGTGDPRLAAVADGLRAEVEAGRRWVWRDKGVAVTLAVAGVLVGLGGSVGGGLLGSVPAVAVAAPVGSLLLGVVVLWFRKERWQVRAQEVGPLVWRPGV